MIINPYQFGVAIDPDAQAFLTATAITDATITSAINQLVIDLKGYGLWSKCYAIYPFVGGTATTHKYNLKDPQDLDAAYRILFNGGWNHSSTGIQGTINTYADTRFPMNGLLQDNAHMSIYCRTDTTGNYFDFGVQYSTINFNSFINCKLSGSFNSRLNTNGFVNALTANTDAKGQYLSTRNNSANISTKKNLNTLNTFTSASTSAGTNTFPYYIGNINFNGGPVSGYYSNREYAFATLGEDISGGLEVDLYNTIQTFQTTLSRQV